MSSDLHLSRRGLLGGMAGLGALAGLGGSLRVARADDGDPRFLIVLGCFGGASMIDAFMPVDRSEALTLSGRGTVNSHDTWAPSGSGIRCVDRATPRSFLDKHRQDMLVMGTQGSSVNHFVAQARWANGRDIHRGRTLAESVAAVHGAGRALANVNMGRGGYAYAGSDPTLDPAAAAQVVTNPITFPLSTHGHRGVIRQDAPGLGDPALREALIGRARQLRDGDGDHLGLEALSPFGQTFAASRVREALLAARQGTGPALEAANLVEKLLFVPDLDEILPLSEYGLAANPEADAIIDRLPGAFPANTSGVPRDRLQAQAALAYLLLKTGTSSAVTLTEPGTDGFLAFDQSHTDHRAAQATHWDRILDTTDRLIGLLQGAEVTDADGVGTGDSLWSKTMIVFATEFGRDKWDTGSGFGTGHHLNNGLLVVSPLLRGDRSLGFADPNNGIICGFDRDTGEATPITGLTPGDEPLVDHPLLPPGEEEVAGALLDVLGVHFEGQQTMACLT